MRGMIIMTVVMMLLGFLKLSPSCLCRRVAGALLSTGLLRILVKGDNKGRINDIEGILIVFRRR